MQRSDIAKQMETIAGLLQELSRDLVLVGGLDIEWHAKADEVGDTAMILLDWAVQVRGPDMNEKKWHCGGDATGLGHLLGEDILSEPLEQSERDRIARLAFDSVFADWIEKEKHDPGCVGRELVDATGFEPVTKRL